MIKTVVILAAGTGSRLLLNNQSKPLHQMGTESLIARHLRMFSVRGVTRFVIVVGYLSDQVKASVTAIKKDHYDVVFVENMEWTRGNGLSVLQARNEVDSDFFLIMADHIFEDAVLDVFMQQGSPNAPVTLAIDLPGPSNLHIDLDDVTKVKLSGDRIVDIGKSLAEYDAYDTGLFRCAPLLFDALATSAAAGNESLSGGILVLAQQGAIDTVSIHPHIWFDIDTPQDIISANRFLLRTAQLGALG